MCVLFDFIAIEPLLTFSLKRIPSFPHTLSVWKSFYALIPIIIKTCTSSAQIYQFVAIKTENIILAVVNSLNHRFFVLGCFCFGGGTLLSDLFTFS